MSLEFEKLQIADITLCNGGHQACKYCGMGLRCGFTSYCKNEFVVTKQDDKEWTAEQLCIIGKISEPEMHHIEKNVLGTNGYLEHNNVKQYLASKEAVEKLKIFMKTGSRLQTGM